MRRETASLLGYDSWADYDAEVKMIGKGKAIAEFIDRITDLSADSAARDKAVLLDACNRTAPMPPTSTGRTSAYYAELVGRSSSPSTRSECGRTSPSSRSVRACSRSPGASSGLTGRR